MQEEEEIPLPPKIQATGPSAGAYYLLAAAPPPANAASGHSRRESTCPLFVFPRPKGLDVAPVERFTELCLICKVCPP